MKKQVTFLTILLIITLLLAGCAHGEEPAEEVQTLNPNEWPQQVESTPVPTPTPFPKISQVSAVEADESDEDGAATVTETTGDAETSSTETGLPVSVMQAVMTHLEPAEMAALQQQITEGATPSEILAQLEADDLQAVMERLNPADMRAMMNQLDTAEARKIIALLGENANEANLEALLSMVSESDAAEISAQVKQVASNALPLRATAVINQDGIIKRTGPGESYAALGSLKGGDIAGIFGRDDSGNWLYTITPGLNRGWLPLAALKLVGDVSNLPVLPANPEPAPVRASASGGTSSTTTSTSVTAAPPAVSDMKPVTTAKINSSALNMRQGPGANYDVLEALTDKSQLEVLAQNKTQDWLLVKTDGGSYGWVSKSFLNLDGSVTEAPVIISARPSPDMPAGQLAPISGMTTSEPQSSRPSSTPTISTQSEAAPAASTNTQPVSASPVAYTAPESDFPAPLSLGQVATAQIDRSKVLMRLGPGEEYGFNDELTFADEEFYILGVDVSRQWALVKREYWEKPEMGWVPLNEMTVDGSVARAPVVVTTWTTGNRNEVRNGPGITYDVIGYLPIETMLAVQAIYQERNWLLVTTLGNSQQVWISRRFVENLSDLFSQLPEVSGPPAVPVDAHRAAYGPQRVNPQGTLVFQTSSGGDIMTIKADGTGLRRLTHGIDPVLSHDGQQVAFTRWQNESTGALWTINLDGSNERHILGEMRKPKGPSWSPDDQRIVLNFQHGGILETYEQCYDAEDFRRPPREARDVRLELKKTKPHVCWDLPPDAHWSLRVVNVTDGSFNDLDGGLYAFRPTWSPVDPNRIVSDGGHGLVDVRLADINLDNSTQSRMSDLPSEGSPIFSPAGQFLAVVIGKGSAGYDIFRLNADGSGRTRLTQTPLWVTAGPDSDQPWSNVAPAWSPDGQLIAFLTNRNGPWEIWVMNADGSDQRPMFSEEINQQLALEYNFVDERAISWR